MSTSTWVTRAGVNWAGSHSFAARGLVHPRSLGELQEVVAAERRVRALGSRHSFTDLADTDGVLVSLDAMPGEIVIDAAGRQVGVGGGVTLGALAEVLHEHGWALPTMASLPHLSVAGTIATSTHGSGDAVGSLAALVARLDLVGADGELVTVRRGDRDFQGWVVALGALGVVHRVTMDVVPTFDLRQEVHTGLAWDAFVADFEATMSSGYSVSGFTDWVAPEIKQLWVKTRGDQPAPELPAAARATAVLHMIPGGELEAVTDQLGVTGPWHQRLPHFKSSFTPSSGVELQSEYVVPRSSAREAFAALRRLGPGFRSVLQMSEIRTLAGDDLWLSGAYAADAVGVHFTWHRDWEGVHAVLPRIEEELLPLGGRPHWGKCFTAQVDRLEPLYPRLDDFRRLRAEVDPGDRFGNRFLDRVLGPVT